MKYRVIIQTTPHKRYQTYMGWDHDHDTKTEALQCAQRARKLWHNARVIKIEPEGAPK